MAGETRAPSIQTAQIILSLLLVGLIVLTIIASVFILRRTRPETKLGKTIVGE